MSNVVRHNLSCLFEQPIFSFQLFICHQVDFIQDLGVELASFLGQAELEFG